MYIWAAALALAFAHDALRNDARINGEQLRLTKTTKQGYYEDSGIDDYDDEYLDDDSRDTPSSPSLQNTHWHCQSIVNIRLSEPGGMLTLLSCVCTWQSRSSVMSARGKLEGMYGQRRHKRLELSSILSISISLVQSNETEQGVPQRPPS